MPDSSNKPVEMDLGNAMIGKGSDASSFKIFGFELHPDPAYAGFLSILLPVLVTKITNQGAGMARQGTKAVVEAITHNANTAAKAGNIGEGVWRFGFPLVDLTLGVARSVFDGRRDLNNLKREASTLLAANHNGKVGIGGVLGKVPTALAYKRSIAFKNAKQSSLSQFTKLFSTAPQWIISYWQYQQNMMTDAHKWYNPEKEGEEVEKQREALRQRIRGPNPGGTANMFREMVEHPEEVYDSRIGKNKNSALNKFLHPRSYSDLENKLSLEPTRLSPALFLPGIGGLIGNLVGGRLLKEHIKRECAWDEIVDLQKFVHGKKGKNTLPINSVQQKVRNIFVQHAKDRKIGEDSLPSGDEFNEVIGVISKAIVEDSLQPISIAEILDNSDVVTFDKDGVYFEGELAASAAVNKYITKYSNAVTNKDFYKNSPFTKKDAANALKNLPDEEKALFVMCFPPGILEAAVKDAGGSEEEIANIAVLREEGKNIFSTSIDDAVKGILGIERAELEAYNVPESVIKRFEILQAQLNHKRDDYIEKHTSEIAYLLRDIAMSSKKPDEFWVNYVSKNGEHSLNDNGDATSKTHASKIDRDNGDSEMNSTAPEPKDRSKSNEPVHISR